MRSPSDSQLAAVSTSTLLCVVDVQGQVVEVSEALIEFLGCEAQDLIGRSLLELFDVDTGSDLAFRIVQRLQAGLPWHGYLQARNAQGQLVILQTTLMHLESPDGSEELHFLCQQVVVEPQDLHLPDAVEHELASRLQIIEQLMAIIEFDPQGYILSANANFLRLMDYSLAEVVSQHHRLFMFPEDAERPEYTAMWQQLRAGQALTGIFRRRRKDGAELWIMGSYNPLFDAEGKLYKLVKHVFDVTRQKQLERDYQRLVGGKHALGRG